MEDKPKFMSGKWQRKLMSERPVAFMLMSLALTVPILFVLRLGLSGDLGGAVQTGLRITMALLFVGAAWLIITERRRSKNQNAKIDAYLEQRYEQTREGPPST